MSDLDRIPGINSDGTVSTQITMREAVAVAIAEALGPMDYDHDVGQWYYPAGGAGTWPIADAAIQAATPHIEAALLSRLAEKAELEKWYCVSPDTQPRELADWLRAQGGQE